MIGFVGCGGLPKCSPKTTALVGENDWNLRAHIWIDFQSVCRQLLPSSARYYKRTCGGCSIAKGAVRPVVAAMTFTHSSLIVARAPAKSGVAIHLTDSYDWRKLRLKKNEKYRRRKNGTLLTKWTSVAVVTDTAATHARPIIA